MAVALDAKGTAASTAGAVTTISDANLTVGASATCLVYFVFVNGNGGINGSPAAHWDTAGTNQAMTLIGSEGNTNGTGMTMLVFGLLNPTAGNKNFTATWTTAAAVCSAFGMSFTGSDTSSIANCFNHQAQHNVVSSTTAWTTTACTTTSPDLVVGGCCAPTSEASFSAVTGTTDLMLTGASGQGAFICHGNAASTFTCSATAATVAIYGGVATNIAAPIIPQGNQHDWPLPNPGPRFGVPDTYTTVPSDLIQSTLAPYWERVILTSTAANLSWIVPPDFNPFNNSIEGIGGGGGGGTNGTPLGAGGGGGAYAVNRNLKVYPGQTVPYALGGGGTGGVAPTGGGDTTFGANGGFLRAKGGGGGVAAGGAGGAAASCFPVAGAHSGGAGAAGQTGSNPGSGGGGAGGFAGNGGNGGGGVTSGFGNGGGGGNGGTAGGPGQAGTSGAGGNSWIQAGPAGVTSGAGSSGSNGTGASGSATSGTAGVKGSNGTEYTTAYGMPQPGQYGAGGGGSGPSGASAANGANGGLYGGGGSGTSTNGTTAGNGAQGLIVITWVPLPVGSLTYPMPQALM